MNNNYITVTQINDYIRMMFDSNNFLKKVYLKGEISNFKNHSSGHLYLTLKDENSRISAIMFRSQASKLNFVPEDGMNVLVTGHISVYPSGGNYQIYIDHMEQDGLGNLYIEFEKLKKKLLEKGYFDPKHKKEIPSFPKKIGIVTAPTGAAIKDIISTIKRRFPLCETILFPALVQGQGAASDIAAKIKIANTYPIDTLIVGRGGGSIEDLWAFNEEIVAEAIYNSKVPVISAVGHEIDVTISDYVADLRAPTPTGAAELAVPTISEVKKLFKEKKIRLNNSITRIIKDAISNLALLKDNYILKNPKSLYEIKYQKLDNLEELLKGQIKHYLDIKKGLLGPIIASPILKNPLKGYQEKNTILKQDKIIATKNIENILKANEHRYTLIIETLKLLNPLNILDKGYSVAYKEEKIIKSVKDLNIGDELKIRFKTGTAITKIKEIDERN